MSNDDERPTYYRVNPKNQRAYWCPTKAMKAAGFETKALGADGPEAQTLARQWNKRWQQAREEERRAFSADRRAGRSYIYFLRVGQRIKIGVSRDPLTRVQMLAANLPDPISQAVIVPGDRADERLLHLRFAPQRTRGEWYIANHKLKLLIIQCTAAGFVVHEDVRRKNESGHRVESQTTAEVESQNGDSVSR